MAKDNFDTTDWEIVDLLAKDGRISAKAIAKNLSLAEATVRKRLVRLVNSGKLKISGLINPDTFEDRIVALVALEVKEAASLDRIGQEISALPSVKNVAIVSGRYDFIVEILVASNKGIINFLRDELSSVAGLGKTETFLILKSFNKWIIPD
ncbi:MAG: Lrp/AsnC family transcriptional regulator [Deltaproteobacteria bacterium]|nr:Lrp/AsnC family transcriptional regulator [Deltaproteobacteria bacterium]